MSLGGACKAIVLPLVSVTEVSKTDKEGFQGGDPDAVQSKGAMYFAYAVQLIIFVAAGYLAWQCNANETTGMRVLYPFSGHF